MNLALKQVKEQKIKSEPTGLEQAAALRQFQVAAQCFEVLGIFLTILMLSLIPAKLRFVAADEGFYLVAARLVADGKVPYIDFFFPQTPYLPYIYAGFFEVFGTSWETGRLATASSTALIGTLLFESIKQRSTRFQAVLAVTVFLTAGLTVAWFSVAKAYSFPTLFLLLSYLLVESVCEKKQPRKLLSLLGGLCGGVAVGSRLLLAPSVALLSLFLAVYQRPKRDFALFLAGLLLALVPLAVLAVVDSESFWFNNIGYHTIRSDLDRGAAVQQKISTVRALFLETIERDGAGFQFLLLSSSALLCSYLFWSPATARLTLIILALIISHLVPTPAWTQYFCHTVPFFVLLLFSAPKMDGDVVSPEKGSRVYRTLLFSFFGLGCISYFAFGLVFFYRYLLSGEGVRGVSERTKDSSRISYLTALGEVIDREVPKGAEVLSVWPGYLLNSRASYVAGYENQFWLRVGDKLTAEERKRYHVADREDLKRVITTASAPYFLLGKKRIRIEERALGESPYGLLARSDEVELYRAPMTPTAPQ